jgi:hypothetical protein
MWGVPSGDGKRFNPAFRLEALHILGVAQIGAGCDHRRRRSGRSQLKGLRQRGAAFERKGEGSSKAVAGAYLA